MTFDLSTDQQGLRDHAHTFATQDVQPRATEIDRSSVIPEDLTRKASDLINVEDPVAMVVAIEEIAAVSAAVAVSTDPRAKSARRVNLSGLRGASISDETPRAHLSLAAAALGVGRAARDAALAEIREATASRGEGDDKPHWIVADVATELEAARMLTLAAAQGIDQEDAHAKIAIARLMATTAARKAVDVALRVIGPEGFGEGAALERLSRDVRALGLLLGGEEHSRTQAAEGLLPM